MKMLMTSLATLAGVAALLALSSISSVNAQTRAAQAALPADSFAPIARVMMHPRCLNCHQSDAPRQTDAGLRHSQGITRGADGRGAAGQRCATCHQGSNSVQGAVPGAAHWHLAPASMSWQGLGASDICRQIKDPARNGNRRTPEQIISHMSSDPLVLWAWQPGAGRSLPPLSHEEFLAALQTWARQGMPCP